MVKAKYLGSLRFNSKAVYSFNFTGSLQQNSAVMEGSTDLDWPFYPGTILSSEETPKA